MNPPGWVCTRRIGYLFPHECDKVSPMGCTDCDNGRLNDPFADRTDRYGYTGYDNYAAAGFLAADDFTEADGENLVRRKKRFEDDMSAS